MRENIVAIIPARLRSKRIKGKNFKKFKGKPIISHTIRKLKKSKIFSRILVSSDSRKIIKISKKAGAEIPFVRPKILSNDYTPTHSVISHCIKFLNNENHWVSLQETIGIYPGDAEQNATLCLPVNTDTSSVRDCQACYNLN